jgi:hypothetical protein
MRTTTRLVALALVMAACSPATVETTTSTSTTSTTSSSTTTTIPTTTTTTLPEPPRSPVTGLPVEDETLLDRRLVAVKIDNHPRARPHAGLDDADMVIEILVEGGFTRYMTMWMESDSDFLGAMRSSRPTDYALLAAFPSPVLVRSGGQDWVTAMGTPRGIRQIGEVPQVAWRLPGRSSPHNLWTDTFRVRQLADDLNFPDLPPLEPIWEFGPMPDSDTASSVSMRFSTGTTTRWDWDAEESTWLRYINGQESMLVDSEGDQSQMSSPVLVVLYVEQYIQAPPSGVSGSSLPTARTTGTGRALVFADGMVVEGIWERDVEQEWFRLSYAEGETLLVPEGRVWVSLVPANLGITYEP